MVAWTCDWHLFLDLQAGSKQLNKDPELSSFVPLPTSVVSENNPERAINI